MPQNPKEITDSPEFKEFVKLNNLGVFNLEAINVLLFQLAINDGDKEERIQKQQAQIAEIAKNIFPNFMKPGKLYGKSIVDIYQEKTEHEKGLSAIGVDVSR